MFIGAGKFESLLLEIKQSLLDDSGIEESIAELNRRPFSNLFKDKGDRFLVKIYNQKIVELSKFFGLDHKKFNIEGGYYDDSEDGGNPKTRYGALLKKIGGSERDKNQLKHILQQRNVFSYALFSRHPMDVIRMSDVGGIESCHSPNKGHFHCAAVESKNSGGIVFELDFKSARWVKDHLKDKDIFDDDDRGVKGINPLSRVRLRRLVDIDKNTDYAIPEERYYSGKGNSYGYSGAFADKVLEYCKKNQELPNTEDIKDPDYIDSNLVFVGGYYSDTEIEELIKNLTGVEIANAIQASENIESSINFILRNLSSKVKEESDEGLTNILQYMFNFIHNKNINKYLYNIFIVLQEVFKRISLTYKNSTPKNRDLIDLSGEVSFMVYHYNHILRDPLTELQLKTIYYIVSEYIIEFELSKRILEFNEDLIIKTFKNYGGRIANNFTNWNNYNNVIRILSVIHREEDLQSEVREMENGLRYIIRRDMEDGINSVMTSISGGLKNINYWNNVDRAESFIHFCLETCLYFLSAYVEPSESARSKIRHAFSNSVFNIVERSKGKITLEKIINLKNEKNKELIDHFVEEYNHPF